MYNDVKICARLVLDSTVTVFLRAIHTPVPCTAYPLDVIFVTFCLLEYKYLLKIAFIINAKSRIVIIEVV